MADEMDLEQAAHEFYKDPANLSAAGPGRRPRRPAAMSGMVPVRFPQDVIVAVRRWADLDGMTVSGWIRRVVMKELKRREPPETLTVAEPPRFGVEFQGVPDSLPTEGTGHPVELVS